MKHLLPAIFLACISSFCFSQEDAAPHVHDQYESEFGDDVVIDKSVSHQHTSESTGYWPLTPVQTGLGVIALAVVLGGARAHYYGKNIGFYAVNAGFAILTFLTSPWGKAATHALGGGTCPMTGGPGCCCGGR